MLTHCRSTEEIYMCKVHCILIQLQIEINDDNYMKQKKKTCRIIYASRNTREKKKQHYSSAVQCHSSAINSHLRRASYECIMFEIQSFSQHNAISTRARDQQTHKNYSHLATVL